MRARGLLTDEGERVERFELVRPLRAEYLTADQLSESNWRSLNFPEFESAWRAEADEAAATLKQDRLYLATGLLLPIWDKIPEDYVRVSRIAAADGRSLLGREIGATQVPELLQALGLDVDHIIATGELADIVLKSGKAMPVRSVEQLTLKRSLVNGNQRLELTGWCAERLDWYKAKGCFTEIIRYQTRLFVPVSDASTVLDRLAS